MEDLTFSNKSKDNMKGGRSKFYSELSFEDDFNPTSHQVRHATSSAATTSSAAAASSSTAVTPSGGFEYHAPFSPSHDNSSKIPPNDDLSQRLSSSAHASPLMCYVIRLKHGDELRKTLKEFAQRHSLKAAFVMTCVGSATTAKIRTANARPNAEANYMLDILNSQEIVSLSGTISGGGHLHIGLADAAGRMCGGHLIELIVDTTAEVVIGDCSALSFSRTFDDITGFNELNVQMR